MLQQFIAVLMVVILVYVVGLYFAAGAVGTRELDQLEKLVGKGISRVYRGTVFLFNVEENHAFVTRRIFGLGVIRPWTYPESRIEAEKKVFELPLFRIGFPEVEGEGVPVKVKYEEAKLQLDRLENKNNRNGKKMQKEILGELRKHGPTGYKVKREGVRCWLPGIWHDVVAVVNCAPYDVTVRVEVSTKDNQTVPVRYRYISVVADPALYAVFVMLQAAGEKSARLAPDGQEQTRKKFETNGLNVLVNQFCSLASAQQLTGLSGSDLERCGFFLGRSFNLRFISYGIKMRQVGIIKIEPPQELQDRRAIAGAMEVAKKSAGDEAARFKTIIETTSADPSKVVESTNMKDMVQNVAGAVRSTLEYLTRADWSRGSKASDSEKKEGSE